MSFLLSKLLWALVSPASLMLLLMLVALLSLRRRPALGYTSLMLATLMLGAVNLAPVAHWLAGPLEARFPAQPLPAQVDGIIVLGGAIDALSSAATQQPQVNGAAERLLAFAELARRYPQAQLIYTGGSGSARDQKDREADIAKPMFAALGLDTQRIVFERDSRNTWENALYSKALVHPQPGQTWLLVTSAWHMPRSVGCFRKAGWNVVPYPVDYIGSDAQDWAKFDAADQLPAVTLAVKEWIGLAAYHLMGRTDAWFPAPR